MAKKTYALEHGGQKRLAVSWKGFYKNITVELDGNTLATFPEQKDVVQGQSIPLPDGSVLGIQLKKTWLSTVLDVSRDGKPLPGTGTDPFFRVQQAYGVIFFIGGLTFGLGAISEISQSNFLYQLGFNWISMVIGGIFLVLGFLVKKQSLVALIITMILYGIDTILNLLGGNISNLVVHIIFLVFMGQGIGAIKAIRAGKEIPEVPSTAA